VGGAVGSNPVPLIIGCHRVLGASGKITGYSGGDGIPTKRWLLNLEGIETKD
jgi:methylated-DNA-[protein]-cysteine S-methyltransferase